MGAGRWRYTRIFIIRIRRCGCRKSSDEAALGSPARMNGVATLSEKPCRPLFVGRRDVWPKTRWRYIAGISSNRRGSVRIEGSYPSKTNPRNNLGEHQISDDQPHQGTHWCQSGQAQSSCNRSIDFSLQDEVPIEAYIRAAFEIGVQLIHLLSPNWEAAFSV